jgi:hypothetical protein
MIGVVRRVRGIAATIQSDIIDTVKVRYTCVWMVYPLGPGCVGTVYCNKQLIIRIATS